MSQPPTLTEFTLPHIRFARGDIKLPGSKSISNRALLLASLGKGCCSLKEVLVSDDTSRMIEALQTLGIPLQCTNPNQTQNRDWTVQGLPSRFPFPNVKANLFLGNAGTVFRPLTAALAISQDGQGEYTLRGVDRMHERPISDLVNALRSLGCEIDYLNREGFPPLRIRSRPISKEVNVIHVKGNVSSQYLSSLLMMLPWWSQSHPEKPLYLQVEGELISKPYIALTLKMLEDFGVPIEHKNWHSFWTKQKPSTSPITNPTDYWIEGDASNASYFLAMGLLGKGPVTVVGVGKDSIQGDIGFCDFLASLGASVDKTTSSLSVSSPGSTGANIPRLPAFHHNFVDIPDAAMTAAVLALFADAPCTLEGIGSWRVKETDRIAAVANECRKLGASVEERNDSLRIFPVAHWQDALIETYDDHRMAMAFSLAAFAPCVVRIKNPLCTAKTFPHYFASFQQLIAA